MKSIYHYWAKTFQQVVADEADRLGTGEVADLGLNDDEWVGDDRFPNP